MATRKVQGQLTAGLLNNDYEETVKLFISEDQGYQFVNSVMELRHIGNIFCTMQWLSN